MNQNVEQRIREVIQTVRVMQLATAQDNRPWCCNLLFATDENLHLYWVSMADSRHSQELTTNPHVAAAIKIQEPPKLRVGLQIEGDAAVVTDATEVQRIVRLYADRFELGDEWYNDFVAGKNPHNIYCLTPSRIALFDKEAFPESRQDWQP